MADEQELLDYILGKTSSDLGLMADKLHNGGDAAEQKKHEEKRFMIDMFERMAATPNGGTTATHGKTRAELYGGAGALELGDLTPGTAPPGTAPPPAPSSEPWPASTDTRLTEQGPIETQARAGIEQYLNPRQGTDPLGYGKSGIGVALGRSKAAKDAAIMSKAKLRANNLMEKRRLQEQMTGAPVPGPNYEETLTQERIKIEQEIEDRATAKAKEGMSVQDVLEGGAPPMVGQLGSREYVFPPGDMRNDPAYQKAKAEADEATEGQVVAETMPDDEQLGGSNPEDTDEVAGPRTYRMGPGGQTLTQEQHDKRFGDKEDQVKGPGDLRRLAAQDKLSQLQNVRTLAESGMEFGNMAVAGDYVPGQTPRASLGKPQLATGIRGEIARITGEEDLYLKSQLRREEQKELFGLRADELRIKAKLDNIGVGPHNLTAPQATALWDDRELWIKGATYIKANEALAAVRAGLQSLKEGPGGEAPLGQAQMLAARQVLKAYGEGSRMSDYDLKSIIYSPQFAGMYDKVYRFVTGRATPQTVALYKDMLTKLATATKEHFKNVKQKRAESFNKHWGVPVSVVLDTYGTIFDESGMPKAAPKGNQIRMTKDGVEEWKMEKDEEAWRRRGWSRA